MKLKQRELQIIDYLLEENRFVNYKVMSQQLNLTERQIRYDLRNIESAFQHAGIHAIKKQAKKGVMIVAKNQVKQRMAHFKKYSTPAKYKYSRKEINHFILLKLLISNQIIPVSEFETELNISRTTVLSHLVDLDGVLFLEDLSLIHHKRRGYIISGENLNKYHLFTRVLLELINIRELYTFIMDSEKVFSKEAELIFFTFSILMTCNNH
ncbi:hypothetical protein G4V62_15010 [Bacillaceae bacterium SIJ1]|uniref:helix-turn-helix domain-containing protein n=1 Tax=Litoribacterium kuwaitense TaxID=1398745 RepID=UPI0013ED70B6|nr:helix-turn-helix domain-containing protein [Litoribacterium kuwaitense]NGP46196.1 hypothetical protein [Litoribacterium kuwaitense]